MPMPHRTQMQIIKRRLTGKEGAERVRELRSILTDLPDYRNGPYADIRKWVLSQIEESQERSRVVHRDTIAVRREGAAQVALVGPPNAGKSSLLHALSNIQIKIDNYAFTTLRPVPALTRIGGVLVQFVEIPGLIEGAASDRGGGRALLGVLRGADAIVYCHDVAAEPALLEQVRHEVREAGIDLPSLVVATKMDEAREGDLDAQKAAFPDLKVVGVSVLDDDSLERFKERVWNLTGLIRIYLCRHGRKDEEPLALESGSTVAEAAIKIHKELGAACRSALLWGPSARFAGQQVGREHRLQDGDTIEIIT
ncbi:MAG: GTPase [Dehalococcoidia bacterium]